MTKRTILVAHDLSSVSTSALTEAIRVARASGAEIVVLHAIPPVIVSGDPMAMAAYVGTAAREREVEALTRIVAHVSSFHVHARQCIVEKAAALAILETADQEHADLIVIGTHARKGIQRAFLGSVAEEVVRKSRRPVLVVKASRASTLLRPAEDFRIIVGVDFSAASLEAVGQAARVAQLMKGRLYLLHACRPSQLDPGERIRSEKRLEAIACELRVGGLTVTPAVVVAGDAARAIVAEAEGDPRALIAVGTRGPGLLSQWLLGSVARDVMRKAPCPVLVAHWPLEAGLWQGAGAVAG